MAGQVLNKTTRKQVPKEAVKIRIDRRLCKRCGICSAFCPQGVLAPGSDGYPEAVRPEACTGCQMCFYRCPDFALTLEVLHGTQPNG